MDILNKKVLLIGDSMNWAIARLIVPLAQRGNFDIAYHYTDGKPKQTKFDDEYHTHLTIGEFEKDYDIFHFHCLRAGISCLRNNEILKKIGGREIVFTIHTERESDLKDFIESGIKVDKVIAPTRYVFDKLKENFRTYLVPHCIEIEKFPYIEKLEGQDVGYIGRVVRHKRYKELVDACKGKWKVNGIGYVDDGEYWRTIDNSGNEFNINIAQVNMNDHIKKHFKIFSCLSAPHIEVGPLPVLECAALGIPIITTPVGWALDNATASSVCMIEDSEVKNKDLGNYIEGLMKSELGRETYRKNARKLIEKFNMDWYLSEHRKIYDSI